MTVKVHTASKFTGKPEAKGYYVIARFNGKRKTVHLDTEAEANTAAKYLRKELDLLSRKASQVFGEKRKRHPTFGTYSSKWLKEQTHLKESTKQRYKSSIYTHLNPQFGRCDLDEITYAMMKDFCIEKAETLCRDSVRNINRTMSVIMEEAVREDLISKHPATRLGRYYGTRTEGRGEKMPFNREELAMVLKVIKQHWPEYWEWVFCAVRTGITFGEQRALYWNDIDFEIGRIHVMRSWSYGRDVTTPKTKARIRKIDMSPQLVDALKAMKEKRQEECLADGKTQIPDYVFLAKEGKPIHAPNFISRVWHPALKEAGVAYRNWHNLRHTFASQLLMAGKNPLYVAQQLGHSKVTTTHNHYAHWIDQSVEKGGVDVLDGS